MEGSTGWKGLDGLIIREAYFIDIKKYGYWYLDKLNNKIERSIISGVPRNSTTFNEIRDIFNGIDLIKTIPNRFFKSFKDLNINIHSTKISIKKNK